MRNRLASSWPVGRRAGPGGSPTITEPSEPSAAFGRFRRGAIYGLINRVALGVLNIAVAVVLARVVSPADFGFYAVFAQLVAVGAMLQGFGMQNGVTRLAGIAGGHGAWEAARQLLAAAARLYVMSGLVLALAFLVTWPLIERELFGRPLGWLVGVLILLIILTRSAEEIAAAYLRGVGSTRAGALLLSAPREAIVLLVALFALALSSGFGASAVVALHAAASAAIAALALLLCLRFVARHRGGAPDEPPATARSLAALSAPMLLHGAGAVVLRASDIWILSIYLPAAEVAFYAAATRVTNLVLFALSVVNIALPPLLASSHAAGRLDEFERLARTAATWSTVVSLPVFLVILVLAEPLMAGLFGTPYAEGAGVLVILAAGQTVSAIVGVPGTMLQMTGHQRLLSALTVGAVVVNVVANLAVVEDYGAAGVAVVTSLTVVGRMALHTYLAWRLTGALSLPDPATLTPRALAAMLARR